MLVRIDLFESCAFPHASRLMRDTRDIRLFVLAMVS